MKYDTFPTSFGEFSIAIDDKGAITTAVFGDLRVLQKYNTDVKLIRDPAALREARDQVRAYFEGKLRKFTLKLALTGTPFQQTVWAALRRIPYGRTHSYGELAGQLGKPTASRAVGGANGANPICVIVPCHRVIGADGSLTGFAHGTEIKRRLLELEGALLKK